MNTDLSNYRGELHRASRLMEAMKTVKYALILDDVWDKFTLHSIGIPKPTMENGCKIVITSRSIDVCNYLRCQVVKVPPLPELESLNLFLDMVGQDVLRIPNLEQILKLMVAECAGLPLAIVVIAGSMRGVQDIFEWRNALRELRQCVVDTEKDSEDEIFKQEAYDEACVKMHDVVRDMALCIKSTGPSRFMVKARMRLTEIPDEDEWNEDLDKVSLMKNEISYIPQNMSPKCLMLSTLTLKGNNRLREISECFFTNMPRLKFLDLSNTGIEVLPNSICNLEYLTTLILCGCESLKHMPSLSKLKALKKLDLDGAGLCEAPEGIEMLENLQYLDLSCPKLRVLPEGKISKLFRLQYLRKHKIFSTDIRAEEVARLKMLEWFEVRFVWLKDFSSFVSKLNLFGRLSHYSLEVGDLGGDKKGHFWEFKNNGLPKKVILIGCQIRAKDELVLPDDLQELRIEYCNVAGDISIFQKDFTQLRTCALEICQGIGFVVSSSSSSSTSSTVMNNLEVLTLNSLFSLRDVVKVEKTRASLAPTLSLHIFSNLKQLTVCNCSKLKKLFPCELLQGQGLQNLELIEVNNCKGMEEIIGWEEEEEGNQTTTPILITLPKLRILKLQSLSELKRICPERGVMVCESLNSININVCLKIKRIPLCLGRKNAQPSLPAVKYISIFNSKKWWESLEWENPDDKNVILPFLQCSSCDTWLSSGSKNLNGFPESSIEYQSVISPYMLVQAASLTISNLFLQLNNIYSQGKQKKLGLTLASI
ncbi:hypothetical protein SLEP1_g16968 [Rubroshorea leprosula]|uniref:NB-ARC domain-containing protein n=1 Tax=Rubroshorea leprosula TaxID=152421 RepID=A0AAV5IYI4_9ROSI|nr:hypothetical protein SLEP1_g16968 [Rubroshorea leprosula]